MHNNLFTNISLLLALAVAISMMMRVLRQPLIIGHILTGILVGPSVLNIIHGPAEIELLAQFGIALLLFIVGLGLNPRVIREVGRVSLLTGVGQVIFTSAFGFLIVRALGYDPMMAFYISVALTFSSTIIILKLLTDKKEQNKLYGKISIGFLLVQDLIATFALVMAAATSQGGLSVSDFGWLVAKLVALTLGVILAAHYILRPMTRFLSRSQELLFLFAIGWGFAIGTLFYELGFSLEVGALVAGVALSSMTYAQEVASRLRPLRDFFIVVFFISLGAKLNLLSIGEIMWQALGLSTFVLIGNPLIVMAIMGLLGYTKKTGFKAGLAVAQISEFSLIFVLLGQANGQVSEAAVSLVTVIGIITIAVSSYMITYSDGLYRRLEKYLHIFERQRVHAEHDRRATYDAVLFGYKKGGSEFVRAFRGITKRYVIVDYDPEVADMLEAKQMPYIYGDATDTELLTEIDLSKTKLVVVLMGDRNTNEFILDHMTKVNPGAVVVCHADTPHQATRLYELGASYVMVPTFIGSEKISAFIKRNGFSKTEFKHYRQKHLALLKELD